MHALKRFFGMVPATQDEAEEMRQAIEAERLSDIEREREKRAHKRVAMQVAVSGVGEDNFFVGFSEDISEGGVFISTMCPPCIGETIDLSIAVSEEQALIRIGDVYLVAHMLRDEEAWGSQDDVGNVQLVLFDLDWTVLEKHTLTFNDHADAGQRPHLAWDGGSTLLMSYDRALELSVLQMTLNTDAFFPPVEGDDTGESGLDTDDTGSPEPPDDCGCGGPASGVLLPHLLLFFGLRRRS